MHERRVNTLIGKISSSFIDVRRDHWFNRIHGDEYKKYLNDYDEIKYFQMVPYQVATTFFQMNFEFDSKSWMILLMG